MTTQAKLHNLTKATHTTTSQEGILFYPQERLPNDAYKTLIAAANNKEKREYRRWLKKFKTIAS